MRIRSIKPEFWRSDDITSLSLEDRLLFIGLWSYVDDSGIGVDKLPHICADLFAPDLAEDPRDTLARVSGGLLNLSERGLIMRYKAENRPYLYITNWTSHQRIDKPGKQRFPGPDQADSFETPAIRDTLARVPESVATGTGEQRNRGTEEQSLLSDAKASDRTDELFDQLWELWPTKQRGTRKKSGASFRTALKAVGGIRSAATILDAAGSHALVWRSWPAADQQFVPQMATWLNQERWTLDAPEPRTAHTGQPAAPVQDIRNGIRYVNGKPVIGGPNGMTPEQYNDWRDRGT